MKRLREWLPAAAAALAALLVQWPALRAPFFADDWLFLDQTRQKTLLAALRSPDPIGNFFRPLGRAAWFWAFGHASGESSRAFHAANLSLWLLAVVLLWALARRVAGPRAAAVAAGVFALTYAADVPVLWASGSQDLLALALALGALLAVTHGRTWAAAALLFASLFAKETALVALAPALLLARRPGEGIALLARRAWPLAAAALAYGVLAAFALAGRHAAGSALALSPWGPLAALAGIARVALGLEWRAGGAPWVPFAMPSGLALAALALAAAAVALVPSVQRQEKPATAAVKVRGQRAAKKEPRAARVSAPVPGVPGNAWLTAGAWVVAGAAPVALVAPLWSAYYFLFAMAGVALLVGLATLRANVVITAAVVLVAGLAAHQARALDEFATAPDAWSGQSHVSRFYVERGMSVMQACVEDIRAARPTVPRHTTFFFSGVPAFAAVQVADGPLVRGIYRDTTVRSFYASAFRRGVLGGGPVYMLFYDNETRRLVDRTDESEMWFSLGIGYLLNNNPEVALEAFAVERGRSPASATLKYATAIASAASGDTAAARSLLSGLGLGLSDDSGDLGRAAARAFAARDSAAARRLAEFARSRAVYDPLPHRLLSALYAGDPGMTAPGVLEAAAAVAFAPGDPLTWRQWSVVQRQLKHFPESLQSLDRYFELAPGAESDDEQAVKWREQLRQLMPGGIVAQRAMKENLTHR